MFIPDYISNNLVQWAEKTIQEGGDTQIGNPKQMTDYELALAINYHLDQIRRCLLNYRTLEIWPENRSPLFNDDTIALDEVYHGEELTRYAAEVERRHIP